MNQTDLNRSATKFGLDVQSLPSAVKFPIYFFYDMDLVDLIIFTVGDP